MLMPVAVSRQISAPKPSDDWQDAAGKL